MIILFLAITLFSCKGNKEYSTSEGNSQNSALKISEKFPDDTYCADVDYHNPNTGTYSSYKLTVKVESNEITQINFPGGGWLDTDHFVASELDEEGMTRFTSDKGYDYKIKIIGLSTNCFTDNTAQAIRCKGKTKKGNQCLRMTDNTNGLCWQHINQN